MNIAQHPKSTPADVRSLRVVDLRLKRTVFDVNNPDHIAVFTMITQYGRQHPTIRFILEAPYLDVRSMMLGKIAEKYCEQFAAPTDEFISRLSLPINTAESDRKVG